MSVLGWLRERLGPSEERTGRGLERAFLDNPAEWMVAMFGGGGSATGRHITPMAAIRNSGVWACVRVISEDLASLPFYIYKRLQGRAKERATEHVLYSLLHDAPNPEMDAMQFVETMQAWSELWPCAYAEIARSNADGSVVSLWPIHPDLVQVIRINNELVYRVQLPVGQVTETGLNYRLLSRDRVFRLRGLSLDGVSGIGAVSTQTEAIALSLALEEYGARFFGNSAQPGGVLQTDNVLKDDVYKRLKESWNDRHKGLDNAHRVAILQAGVKWQATGMQNDQAQFGESRRFQLEEAARIWRVPPHLIQDLSRSTNNNIEHQSIDYVTHTLRPRAVRWERAVSLQLMMPADREEFFAEFLLDALLRGDSASEASALQTMRQNGAINADEWRAIKNMNPIGGDQGTAYLVNGNMTTVDKILAPPVDEPPVTTPDSAPGADAPAPAGDAKTATPDQAQDSKGLALNLNGAQVASATEIIKAVAAGEMPRDSGIAALEILFGLKREEAERLIGTAGTKAPTTPNPVAGGAPAAATPPPFSEQGAAETTRAALLPLLEAEMGRMLRRHAKAMASAAKKDVKGMEKAARTFFAEDEPQIRAALEPILRAAVTLMRWPEDMSETSAAAVAKWLAGRALDTVAAAVRSNTADPLAAVTAVAKGWEDPAAARALATNEMDVMMGGTR